MRNKKILETCYLTSKTLMGKKQNGHKSARLYSIKLETQASKLEPRH